MFVQFVDSISVTQVHGTFLCQASFGITIGTLIIATTIINPNLSSHCAMCLGVSVMALLLLINHGAVYAGAAQYAPAVNPNMLKSIGLMRVMSCVMLLWFGVQVLTILAFIH